MPQPASASIIQSTERVIAGVERIGMLLAAAFLFAIKIIVVSDVFCPYDLIAMYLMAGLFFLVLSSAYAARAHVGVDILYQMMPPRLRHVADLVTNLAGLVLFGLIARIGFDRFLAAFLSGDIIAGSIPWPTWLSYVLVPLGAGMLALRMLVHAAADIVSISTGEQFNFTPENARADHDGAVG